MSPKQKSLFKKEYSGELFRIAKGDLLSAQILLKDGGGRLENIVYLGHQATEKTLKAVLNHLRIEFPLVHELGTLVALLPDDKMPPGGFNLSELNPYATVLRYVEPDKELTLEEVEASLKAVQAVIDWADEIL